MPLHELMTTAIRMYGPDAIPWSQHERSDFAETNDGEAWESIDDTPTSGPVHHDLPTTDSSSEFPF
jgi:hypothetical protein